MSNKLTKSDILTIRREPLINHARNIIPVASVWDTAPTDLAACTDGDPDTATGFGSTVMGASGNFGLLDFTLPEFGIYLIICKLGYYSTANTLNLRVRSKADGINFTWTGLTSISRAQTSEEITCTRPKAIIGTEFQLWFHIAGAATCFARIFEVYALKVY